MTIIGIDIPVIPHGHGLSVKKGVADGLLGTRTHESEPHETHSASYERGLALGATLKEEISKQVKA